MLTVQPGHRLLAGLCAALALIVLPVGAIAKTVIMPAPVAVIYPGQKIEPGSLSEEEFEVNASTNVDLYALKDEQLVGKVAVNTLLPGRAIALNAVREPYLVRRGLPTVLIFNSGGLVIQAVGTALEPGSAGDFIRVRNADSGKIVSGTVMTDGSVKVGFK